MPEPKDSEFDAYAGNYDEALAKGISVSGEDKDYFAAGRVEWLAKCLKKRGVKPATVLDFGCGTGSAVPYLLEILAVEKCIGTDTSEKSIEIARKLHGSERARFEVPEKIDLTGSIDLAFCNGVFHHIPIADRPGALAAVFNALRPGGFFAFWENNPWNPGTRYVMSRIPFDRDAIMLSPPHARSLLQKAGFEVLQSDFLFYFPRVLSWFRRLEPGLTKLPLGAQYLVLAAKP